MLLTPLPLLLAGPSATENFSEFKAQFFVIACQQSQKDMYVRPQPDHHRGQGQLP
jgi:hypothetical protein